MHELIPVLTREDIQSKIIDIASKISDDYRGKELVLIGVLKGAFVFLADLIRHLTIPVQVDFLQTASYGNSTSSNGIIQLKKKIEIPVPHKHVLIVEDIVDTGLTLEFLVDYLKNEEPESVKICALIDKRERRQTNISVDYVCYKIDKGFLVGYGLDYAEQYRGLPGIYHLKL